MSDIVKCVCQHCQRVTVVPQETVCQLLSEAETREMEARAKALEEAAKVADEMPVLLMTSPVHVKAASPQDVARRIRALQSEER